MNSTYSRDDLSFERLLLLRMAPSVFTAIALLIAAGWSVSGIATGGAGQRVTTQAAESQMPSWFTRGKFLSAEPDRTFTLYVVESPERSDAVMRDLEAALMEAQLAADAGLLHARVLEPPSSFVDTVVIPSDTADSTASILIERIADMMLPGTTLRVVDLRGR